MPRIVCTKPETVSHGDCVTWLRGISPALEFRNLFDADTVETVMRDADALLLPGGGDPDPALYGREDARGLCDIDSSRDAIELHAIEIAKRSNIPVLGICRGLQIVTVAFGGSLHSDLPSMGIDGHHRQGGRDSIHDVRISPGSLLHRITGEEVSLVNSAHHQGVDAIPTELSVSARCSDGIVEAMEWREPLGKAFLMLIHWHPERLAEGHPLRDSIGRAFLSAIA